MGAPGTERRLPGQELGRIGAWRLVGILGRGSMGAVYLAERDGLPRAALKVLHDQQVRDGEEERFRREVEALRRLDHAGIVRVLDAGRERGRAYLATELVQGETLDRVLGRRGKLPPWEAARLALDLASALDHAHRHGVVHRDLKPSNVIVDPAGRARLLDFGVARLTDAGGLTRTGEILGTPLYMAPEQILGERGVDHRIDVWALGVVLYECLTGQRPFSGPDLPAVCASICATPLRPPRALDPALPAALEAVVLRALARERDERYPDMAGLARDLRDVLSPPAPAPATTAAPGAPVLRAPHLLAAGLLAAGGLVAGAVAVGRSALAAPSPAASAPAGPDASGPDARELLVRVQARARARAPADELLPLLDQALQGARHLQDPTLAAEVLLARADLLRRRGRFPEAVQAADELSGRSDRAGLEAGIVRGLALLRLGREAQGLEALEEVRRADPQGPSGLTAGAIHAVFTGDDRALELAEAALARDPQHVQARTTRGWALLNANRTQEAVTALREQAAEQPDDPRVLYGLGCALRAAGDLEGALTALDEALALLEPPGFWRLILSRLDVLAALGRDQPRLDELDRWLTRQPDHAEGLIVRGALRTALGEPGARGDWLHARQVAGAAGYRELVERYLGTSPLAQTALDVEPR